MQHPQQDMLLLPYRAPLGAARQDLQRCSQKFASNGSRLKENFIFELVLGYKIGTVFGRFNAINSKFWRMSPPEWPWGF